MRCEHSLANPELYRSAARDDPESLLEGVAMAGLVGIVRQLGDLAEYVPQAFNVLRFIPLGRSWKVEVSLFRVESIPLPQLAS